MQVILNPPDTSRKAALRERNAAKHAPPCIAGCSALPAEIAEPGSPDLVPPSGETQTRRKTAAIHTPVAGSFHRATVMRVGGVWHEKDDAKVPAPRAEPAISAVSWGVRV